MEHVSNKNNANCIIRQTLVNVILSNNKNILIICIKHSHYGIWKMYVNLEVLVVRITTLEMLQNGIQA